MMLSPGTAFSEEQIQYASWILGMDGPVLRSRIDADPVHSLNNDPTPSQSGRILHQPSSYRASPLESTYFAPQRHDTPQLGSGFTAMREHGHARSASLVSPEGYKSDGRSSVVSAWPAAPSPHHQSLHPRSISALEDSILTGPCSKSWGIEVSYRRRPRHRVSKSISKPRQRSTVSNELMRADTALTRKMNACIRCRNQKLRCKVNPMDPTGACMTCMQLTSPVFPRLPCLRLKITEASLFRDQKTPDLSWSGRWKSMRIEDIHNWAGADRIKVSITHGFQGFGGRDVSYDLELRQFVPQQGDRLYEMWSDNGMMKEHYVPPFAIADMHDAARELQSYIKKVVTPSINKVVGSSEDIYWETYQMAVRHSYESTNEHERKLLDATLLLWVMSRITSRHEWICSEQTIGSEVCDTSSPFNGTHPLPPVMSAQLEVICFSQFLRPLTKTVLQGLQKLVTANEHKSWLTLFLTLFILLHSCSLTTRRDAEWAAVTLQGRQFANPTSIAEHHRGVLTMLAHFHHANKGRHPFDMALDPQRTQELVRFADLNPEQLEFVQRLAQWARRKQHEVPQLRADRAFGDDYYFVSQLFDETWEPAPVA